MRHVTRLQLVIQLLVMSALGFFVLAIGAGFTLLGMMEEPYVRVAVLSAVVLTGTIITGWVVWLFPILGEIAQAFVWGTIKDILWLFGVGFEHSKWEVNFWRPASIILGLVAVASFLMVHSMFLGILAAGTVILVGIGIYQSIAIDGPFNSGLKDHEIAETTTKRIVFGPHPVFLFFFGLEDLLGPFKIIGLMPFVWVLVLLMSVTRATLPWINWSPSQLALSPWFWAMLPPSFIWWFIWLPTRGRRRGIVGTKDGRLLAVEPSPGLLAFLRGEVEKGSAKAVDLTVENGKQFKIFGIESSIWEEWNPNVKVGNDQVRTKGIRLNDTKLIWEWVKSFKKPT